MKGRPVFALAIAFFIAIIVTNVPQSDALTAAETCAISMNETYIGDPSSCQAWNYCIDGKVAYSGKCSNGLMYDVASGDCDYASNVQCNTNITTMCVGETNIYKADPGNCQNYCYCKDGVSACAACPNGQYFDPTTVACIYQEDSSCSPNSPCALAQNGFVKGVNCTNWVRCFNGQQAGSGNCGTGLQFNSLTGACDYATNVKCVDSSGPPTPGTSAPTPVATPNTCTGVTAAGTYKSGVTVNTDSCRGFFVCATAAPAGAVYGLCPANSQFNPTTEACNDPNQVACAGNRCEGIDRKWMTVAGSSCKKYTVCTNGVPGPPTNCNSEFPYYNEVDQACQSEPPGFPICTLPVPII